MSFLVFVAAMVLVAVAIFYLGLARRGSRAIGRIVRLDTIRIADIIEGPVELTGTIRAIEKPIRAPSGHRCVYAMVKVEGSVGSGKSRHVIHSESEDRLVPAELVDETGAKVRVDLENVEVLGSGTMISGHPSQLRQSTKSWTKNVPERAQGVTITETIVVHDRHVILSGRATVIDSKVAMEQDEGSYRDGAPGEKKTFLISGTEEEPILVTEGTERQLLWQAGWPVAVLAISAAIALAFAGVLIAVIIA